MSRSGYTDDCENLMLYRASVDRALSGKRGQEFLRELAFTLDAMPVKELVAGFLEEEGAVCALGSVGKARRMDMAAIDAQCPQSVGKAFGIARSMAAEIVYINDEDGDPGETPAERWRRVRMWVQRQF